MAVEMKKREHLIHTQYESEQAMLAEFEQSNYTYNQPYVKLNPYHVVPLAAVVAFKTEEPVAVTVAVK